MRSAWYVLGQEVEAFEQEFAAYCGVKYCVGVGNGLEALHLTLRAYGIGETMKSSCPRTPISPPGWPSRMRARHRCRSSPTRGPLTLIPTGWRRR